MTVTIQFTDKTQHFKAIDTYDWDFGDGTAHSSSQNPSHEYAEDGTYVVTLTVTDVDGAVSVVSHNITTSGSIWTHTFDFTTENDSWEPGALMDQVEDGYYQLGTGWIGAKSYSQAIGFPATSRNFVNTTRILDPRVITSVSVDYTLVGTRNVPTYKEFNISLNGDSTGYQLPDNNYQTPGSYTKTWLYTPTSDKSNIADKLELSIIYGGFYEHGADSDAQLIVTSITVSGLGTDPFESAPPSGWSHTFDFTVDNGGWATGYGTGIVASYSASGWGHSQYTPGSTSDGWRSVNIRRTFGLREITSVRIIGTYTPGSFYTTTYGLALYLSASGGSPIYSILSDSMPSGSFDLQWTGDEIDIGAIRVHMYSDLDTSAPYVFTGSILITSIIVTGEGSDPF